MMDPAGEPAIAALRKLRASFVADRHNMRGDELVLALAALDQAVAAVEDAYDLKVVKLDDRRTVGQEAYTALLEAQEKSGLAAETLRRFLERHGETAREYLGMIGYGPVEGGHKDTT